MPGSMIRHNRVNGAVHDALPEGLSVRAASERRIHLKARVTAALPDVHLTERQMMRRYIAGNVHTIRLGAAHLLQGDGAAQVREVHPPPRLPCQGYSSGDADFLTTGGDRLQAGTRTDKPIVHLTAAEELRFLGVLHQQGKIPLCALQRLT